jgi:amino-acid N-acetyltransferase
VALPELSLREAEPEDSSRIRALLSECRLPIDGVPEDAALLLVASHCGQVVGVAGLELHGHDGLLRSVAVAPGMRGRKIADRLCDEIEARAPAVGARSIYLLTETAERYFARRGYSVADRRDAPPAIIRSRQFARLCPASAVLMMRRA